MDKNDSIYLHHVEALNEREERNQLSCPAYTLYHRVLHKAHGLGWPDCIRMAPHEIVRFSTKNSYKSACEALCELLHAGLIDFSEDGIAYKVRVLDGDYINVTMCDWGKSLMAKAEIRMPNAEDKAWRKAVLRRDNSTCQMCGKKNLICVHHKKCWKDYPELRYDVDNGITLCRECHKLLHKNESGEAIGD